MRERDVTLFRDVAAVVWLGGEDRLGFLERMSTQRTADLGAGQGRASVLTADNGRAIELLACHAGAEGTALITTAPGSAAVVTEQLRRYVMFRDRVRATDASSQVELLRLLGPDAPGLASTLTGLDASDLAPGAWIDSGEGATSVWLLRHPEPGGMGGMDVVVPAGQAAETLAARLRDAGARVGSAAAYTRARIAALMPAYGYEIDGEANPLELGLRALVDFDKGCYIGQEVVARLENYEKVQRRLVRLASEEAPSPGARLEPLETREARRRRPGRVTSVAPRADGRGWQALALVPADLPPEAELLARPEHGAPIRLRIDGSATPTIPSP